MQIKNPIKLDTILIVEATNILSQSIERTINHGALQLIIVLLQQDYTNVPQSGFWPNVTFIMEGVDHYWIAAHSQTASITFPDCESFSDVYIYQYSFE